MQNNYINFKKERDLGAIISDTFMFIREEYKPIFRLYLKHVGWLLLLVVAASTYYQYQSLSFTGNILEGGAENFLFELISTSGIALLLMLLSSLAYSALSITTINSIIKSYVKNEGVIKDEEVSQYIGLFFSRTLGSFVVYIVLIFIGFLLCILPGIYLFVPLTLIFPIIVFQEKSFSEAFSECFKLIRQNWWITFATLLIITILVSLISGLFSIPLVVISALETFTSLQEGAGTPGTANLASNWLYMTLYVLASLAQYILGLATLVSIALIYFNLNEFHNKTGTLEDIDRIGS
ncbi:hypothetical protein [Psychroflexus sediminis]|uniref:Membrane domain of glycerophosphoryl diester phosphodiesterase n=1 Tax=Psychroflexus sediminis TaxID=470826 RepID=A0A1G7XHV3_9FLAO|nr:hypothetical protein [Psychroflexus sediminis]SDG83706.1 hypothetical protein SAMN04488027_108121 [Psychroflexus sediminis]